MGGGCDVKVSFMGIVFFLPLICIYIYIHTFFYVVFCSWGIKIVYHASSADADFQ